MLQLMYLSFNIFQRCTVVRMEGKLVDDLAGIHTLIDIMDGDAEHFHAVLEGIGDAVRAGEEGSKAGCRLMILIGKFSNSTFPI